MKKTVDELTNEILLLLHGSSMEDAEIILIQLKNKISKSAIITSDISKQK